MKNGLVNILKLKNPICNDAFLAFGTATGINIAQQFEEEKDGNS